jgi:hypothetical protein
MRDQASRYDRFVSWSISIGNNLEVFETNRGATFSLMGGVVA